MVSCSHIRIARKNIDTHHTINQEMIQRLNSPSKISNKKDTDWRKKFTNTGLETKIVYTDRKERIFNQIIKYEYSDLWRKFIPCTIYQLIEDTDREYFDS